MKKGSLLYFYVGASSFVSKDIEILSKEYQVHAFNFSFERKWKTPIQLLSQFIFLLRLTYSSKLTVCQLAGYHSFLPVIFGKILNKPSLIIAAGTDCHAFPSVGYGNFQKTLLKQITKFSFLLCSHISPKHKSLILCDYTFDDADFPKQGIKYFIPKLRNKFTCIPNGYDDNKFKKRKEKKKNTFLTVSGNLNSEYQIKLKGIDLILSVAKDFPDCLFTIIGVTDKYNPNKFPSNVICHPPLPNEELVDHYSEAEFYLQLSMAEGFPNALCEAMLCECVPIGSNVFSIPEIISDTGYILKKRNLNDLRELIGVAINADKSELGMSARTNISRNYPLIKRETELLELINTL